MGSPTTVPTISDNIEANQKLSGLFAWQARPDFTVDKVDFRIDGAVVAETSAAPYAIEYDTRQLADGSHSFQVVGWRDGREEAQDWDSASVDNVSFEQVWQANPASGNFKAFDFVQTPEHMNESTQTYSPGPDARLRISLVAGRPSFRSEVRKGESTEGGDVVRADAYVSQERFMGFPENTDFRGQTWRYRFSVHLPWNDSEKYVVKTQTVHNVLWNLHTAVAASASVMTLLIDTWSTPFRLGMFVSGGTDLYDVRGTTTHYHLLAVGNGPDNPDLSFYNKWHDFEYFVHYQSDDTGWFEIRMDGQLLLPRTYRPTAYRGDPGLHMKIANYSGSAWPAYGDAYPTSVVHHGVSSAERQR